VDSTAPTHRRVKRLGQNFLSNLEVAEQIVSSANISRNDTVLEPGAGLGVLTRLLEKRAGRVIAVEKDGRLAAKLRRAFYASRSVEVIEGDVLKVKLPVFNKVVGTPPYYISSKLILFLQDSSFAMAHLVFQKEFAARLQARPGTPDYGRLSVTAQRHLTIRSLLEISRESFEPMPKVDSVLLSIEPKAYRTDVDAKVLDDMVRAIFTQRRRLVRGALLHFLKLKMGPEKARTVLSRLSVPSSRVYELSIEDLEELALQLRASGGDAPDG
jgi:16S rRNA (adenine1518-N6/adenine1519-N6)-dimethyltransferase